MDSDENTTLNIILPGERLWRSDRWVDYFHGNERRLMTIRWADGVHFSRAEHLAIAASLREFQLGESGEGRHLKKVAAGWARRSGDTAYLPALELFIAEEQRHAGDLGRVMDLAGIERARRTTVDTVFRHLRKLAGLELSVVVLVTAELVAQVYYRCLLEATTSSVLRTLCRQILRDEVQHVRFQCQRLAILRARRWRLVNAIWVAAHWVLLLVTSLVIWQKHGPVIRRGGLGYVAFVRSLVSKMRVARASMTPPRRGSSDISVVCFCHGRPIKPAFP